MKKIIIINNNIIINRISFFNLNYNAIYIYEYQIENSLYDDLISELKIHTESFKASQVYMKTSEKKIINEELRLSSFRTLVDEKIFNIGDVILNKINNEISGKKFIIHKNDIMHIIYDKDGYFKRHEDYLSINSNIIEEYSMIVCVTPIDSVCDGGETIIELNKFFRHISSQILAKY